MPNEVNIPFPVATLARHSEFEPAPGCSACAHRGQRTWLVFVILLLASRAFGCSADRQCATKSACTVTCWVLRFKQMSGRTPSVVPTTVSLEHTPPNASEPPPLPPPPSNGVSFFSTDPGQSRVRGSCPTSFSMCSRQQLSGTADTAGPH